MKRFLFLGLVLILAACSHASRQQSVSDNDITVRTTRIWEEGYASFPSIVRFRGKYYVSFREGYSHIFNKDGQADGKARIICSADGETWESAALFEKEGYDLRDPKLSVTPDGRLMISMGGSVYVNKKLIARYPQVSFSEDGQVFSELQRTFVEGDTEDDQEWIWRVTWHEGTGYAVTYGRHFALLKTTDGINFDIMREFPEIEGFPNEATVRFSPEGKMFILIRRDGDPDTAYWASSSSPYTDWKLRELPMHVGGPELMVLENGKTIIGGRYHFGGIPRTVLWSGNEEGDFSPTVILPSGEDNSYPGFITVGDELWTVYYSSHELRRPDDGRPRAAVYLSKMPVSMFK